MISLTARSTGCYRDCIVLLLSLVVHFEVEFTPDMDAGARQSTFLKNCPEFAEYLIMHDWLGTRLARLVRRSLSGETQKKAVDGGCPRPVTRSNTGLDPRTLVTLFAKAYPFAIGFGGLSFILSFFRTTYFAFYWTLAWHVTLYASAILILLLRRHIATTIMFRVLLGLVFGEVVHSLMTVGLAGVGMMTLAMLATLAGIFIGMTAGMVLLAAGTLAACVIGAGVWTGIIPTRPDIAAYVSSPVAWLAPLACVAMYTVPIIIAADGIHRNLASSLFELRNTNSRLLEEMSMRRDREEELSLGEAKYRHIFEHSVEGIFQMYPDGRLLNVNPALARMAGYTSPDQMIRGTNDDDCRSWFNLEDGNMATALFEKPEIEEGIELRVRTGDYETLWIRVNIGTVRDAGGEVLYYEGTVENITKRKLAEIALQESEVKYRTVVENSLAGFYIVQDGFFRFVNARFCVVTGYAREEIIDRMKPDDVVQPDGIRAIEDSMDKTASDRMGSLEVKMIRKDRSALIVKVLVASTIYGGRPAYFGTFIDITQEKTLGSQLRQAQKMEAIGTLAGGIAHDFNNILTALMGYGTLLQMKLEPADPLRHYVEQILSASQKAANLTQSLLTFGRLQPVSLKPVSLNGIVRGVENLLRRLITDDIVLTTDLGDEELIVMADTTLIDQILFNLAANARDAMPGGGSLTIATKLVYMDEDFKTSYGFGENGRYALMAVSDTGTGMEETTKQRIFDPFYTTKEVGKGTGLGLSIVYGIVKQHRGYITVSSKPSRGSTFHIYLPVVNAVPDETLSTTTEHVIKGTETILVADDGPEARNLMKDLLSHYGYTVIEAVDGEDAIDKFMSNEHISLTILDSVMPGKNGREVFDRIRTARADAKVLFVSGYTRDIVLGKGIEEGEVDFIEKPLAPREFLKKVQSIIAR